MTAYVICQGIAAAQNPPGVSQAGPPPSNLPNNSQAVDQSRSGAGTPVGSATNPTWHAILNHSAGPGGVCSGTFTPLVSNDGINWTGGGIAPIVIASGPAPQSGMATTTANWAYYSGYWSAIAATGGNPSGKCVVNV